MVSSSADSFDTSALEADDLGGSRFVVGCAHREVNDRDERYDGLALLPVDDQQQMRFDEGLDFESEVFDELSRLHGVSSMRLFDDVDGATSAAMARGDRLIIGASLPVVGHRGGRPDVLVRFGDQKMANGKWAYLPVDVKNSKPLEGSAKAKQWPVSTMAEPWYDVATPNDLGTGKPKTDHGLQLAHYWLLLADLGHAPDIDAVGERSIPIPTAGILGSHGVLSTTARTRCSTSLAESGASVGRPSSPCVMVNHLTLVRCIERSARPVGGTTSASPNSWPNSTCRYCRVWVSWRYASWPKAVSKPSRSSPRSIR